MGGFKSSNPDFCGANFDTMKLFHYAVLSKSFLGQRLLAIEKARWFRIKTIVLIWWAFRDSNPGPTGYEPVALTN